MVKVPVEIKGVTFEVVPTFVVCSYVVPTLVFNHKLCTKTEGGVVGGRSQDAAVRNALRGQAGREESEIFSGWTNITAFSPYFPCWSSFEQ